MAMKYDSKELIDFFFSKCSDPSLYLCRNEKCGNAKSYKQAPKSGFSNLRSHLLSCIGPNYEQIFREQKTRCNGTLDSFSFVNNRDSHVFDLLEWVIMRNQPLTEIDDPITQRHFNKQRISSKSLRKYILNLTHVTEEKVVAEIPNRFGLMLDGWTECRTHYIAIIVIYKTSDIVRETLLAIAPLLQEDDLGAEQHLAFIEATLKIYGKNLSNVIAFIGDNCSVNKSLSTISEIPLIGCASHKFNLAVEQWIESHQETNRALKVIHDLMIQLRTLKNAAKLREMTHLGAIAPNETRWTSKFEMLRRFFRIEEQVQIIDEVEDFLPDPRTRRILIVCLKHFRRFHSITINLQKMGIMPHDVRYFFDQICNDYPSMEHYLGPDASIIQDVCFEKALCKILRGDDSQLSAEEKSSIKSLRNPTVQEPSDNCGEIDESYFTMMETKRRRLEKKSDYLDCSFLTATSNTVERLFSACRHVLTDCRKKMSPILFEAIMFLRVNRRLWDMKDVAKAIKAPLLVSGEVLDDDSFYVAPNIDLN